jgi:iron complex transport system ATP-binding protein
MSVVATRVALHAGERTLVVSLDLVIEPGEILGILGPNGAGKSTLLSVLAGLALPAQGSVTLDGQPLATLPPLARAQHVGLLPQTDEAGYLGSVADFVALGRYPFDAAPLDLAPHLEQWELGALARRAFMTLSGGERQRARLAQLAVQAPRVALLDEPLTHLDPAHQARMLGWARAQADAGSSVALTLHDPNWAACHCDRLLFLYGDGRWRLGTPETLLTAAALEALYGPGTAALWRPGAQPQVV